MHARGKAGWLVPGLFALATAVTAAQAGRLGAHAVSHPSAHAWLSVAYGLLRTTVSAAFTVFTIGRSAPRRPSRSPLAFCACAAAMGAVVVFGPPPADTPAELILAGEMIAVASCIWLVVAIRFLGRCFGVLPEARGLVTRGPYGFVRHPLYVGEIGACLGLLIAAPTVLNALAFAGLGLAQTVRMGLEERALTAAFPAYAAYAERVPRLIPSLRRLSPGAGPARTA
jgi:protein-S-isoprenylcysteine O-methyltransferase Ste14